GMPAGGSICALGADTIRCGRAVRPPPPRRFTGVLNPMRVTILPAILLLAACGGQGPGGDNGSAPIALPSGEVQTLTAIDVEVGTGEPLQRGDTAVVHYTGWLYDPDASNRRGQQFDSRSEERRVGKACRSPRSSTRSK